MTGRMGIVIINNGGELMSTRENINRGALWVWITWTTYFHWWLFPWLWKHMNSPKVTYISALTQVWSMSCTLGSQRWFLLYIEADKVNVNSSCSFSKFIFYVCCQDFQGVSLYQIKSLPTLNKSIYFYFL